MDLPVSGSPILIIIMTVTAIPERLRGAFKLQVQSSRGNSGSRYRKLLVAPVYTAMNIEEIFVVGGLYGPLIGKQLFQY